jgi:hypothetical protein
MVLSKIQSDIESIENLKTLYEEQTFDDRADAIDFIDFHVIDRIDQLLTEINPDEELLILRHQANNLKLRLENVNIHLFKRLRQSISSGICTGKAFKNEIDKYITDDPDEQSLSPEIGYDNLDMFINGIFPINNAPVETMEREPEMVYYQKTPSRIIFELVKKAHFTKNDVFYDLGSGLGHVCMLVNLLSEIRSIGIEFEPEFYNYSKYCAAELNLKNVEFINSDVRSADFSDGTVFFMYTPFTGSILETVLDKLRELSRKRIIRIFTYGPCTIEIAKQTWLISTNDNDNEIYRLKEFRSNS